MFAKLEHSHHIFFQNKYKEFTLAWNYSGKPFTSKMQQVETHYQSADVTYIIEQLTQMTDCVNDRYFVLKVLSEYIT